MRIPIQALKDIAAAYNLTHIVMLAYHPDDQTNHVVTYGKSVEDCSQAADFGNKLKDALGWPESLHAQPSRVKKLESQIESLEARNKELEAALKPFADLGWVEEYTQPTPNVCCFVSRQAIENAKVKLNKG